MYSEGKRARAGLSRGWSELLEFKKEKSDSTATSRPTSIRLVKDTFIIIYNTRGKDLLSGGKPWQVSKQNMLNIGYRSDLFRGVIDQFIYLTCVLRYWDSGRKY